MEAVYGMEARRQLRCPVVFLGPFRFMLSLFEYLEQPMQICTIVFR